MVTNKQNGDKNMNDLYSKYDLCETLKLSVATIDNRMKDGSLEYYKIGKSVRFDDKQIEMIAVEAADQKNYLFLS